jgi:hypothetical protein
MKARTNGQNEAWTEFSSLPADAQREVLDFIAFLRVRRGPSPARRLSRRPRLTTEAFVGMWRDRSDLSDSTVWVRGLRETEW